MLAARGVDTIFGIPGVHNQEMYRGINEAGITHVLARHEQGAGFMADGYARATGRVGVAYVITGPGLCNIMTPMGQAYSDSVPMLVISSCLDETAATKGQLHQMKDQEGAASTVCDWSVTARHADAAYALIDRAFAEFEAGRARPKHITVPISVLQADAPSPPAPNAHVAHSVHTVRDSVIHDLANQIKAAAKPLFVFGGGCIPAKNGIRLEDPVRALLRRSGAAAFTTYAGRGLLACDDPMAFGAYLARPSSAEVFAKADLVVVFGSELSECDLWRPDLGHDCPLVRVDIDPGVLAQKIGTTTQLQADATQVVMALGAALPQITPPKWAAGEIAQTRQRWRSEVDAERSGIVPICDALRAAVPKDTMIYSDMTQFAYVAKEVWDMEQSGHWHHPTGFGTLGYATPAAIGGSVARGGKPTLTIIGDYGFQYTVQELGTAVELGLNLPIILWDNDKLQEIEDSMTRAQIAPHAVQAHNPDFCKLAQAYGANAAKPTSLLALVDAVQTAFEADKPTLIHVTPAILDD
ncbi:thiamine pyrophosphate-binding protein [Nereida sp. MMG025]|uniref:thiamine pyrophosphate-binding protein n=1 Tax=Nereida sp. MMG025 TaxID=2909981 RepID=UPI001EFFAB7D|nr:thiamine pyrophosphate-dependent enzyme [Nereida sp. MMG025]